VSPTDGRLSQNKHTRPALRGTTMGRGFKKSTFSMTYCVGGN